jgi:hypothetical protein
MIMAFPGFEVQGGGANKKRASFRRTRGFGRNPGAGAYRADPDGASGDLKMKLE